MSRLRPLPRLILSGLLLSIGSSARAQEAPPPAVSEFEADGVKVIVQPRPASQTVAAGIFVRGGRAALTPAGAGIESLLLAAALEGSAKFPRDAQRAELARLAAGLDYRCLEDYSVVSLRSTTAAFAETMAILLDAVLHPALETQDVERVRTRLVAAAASEADIDRVRRRRSEETIYRGHPYAPPSEGTPATLRAFAVEALRSHHRDLLRRSRLLVVVAGGVDESQVRAAIGRAFASLPAGGWSGPPVPALAFASAGARRVPFELSLSRAEVVFASPSPRAPDFPALQMAASILQHRLFEVVRDREALSYDPSVEIEVRAAPHGAIRFSASDPNAVAGRVGDQVERLRREAVPASLLQATAAVLRSNELTAAQTNEAQAARLAEFELIRGGWRNAHESRYAAVTAAEVQAAARRYLGNLQYFLLAAPGVRLDDRALGP